MTTSICDAGLALIRKFEGLRLTAYPDPGTGGTPWTIGYGHTGDDVYEGLEITAEQAEALLRDDLQVFEEIVNQSVQVPVNDNEFSALVSLVYNVGPGRACHRDGIVTLKSGTPSTLLRKLNVGDRQGAAAEFPKWSSPNNPAVHAGLLKRRLEEQALFLTAETVEVA